ncbi:MAG: TRAP transporter substrate-binding protein DctP [Proteobacteria bacterium]|nr:TRAP transporter substrate-binding protein DctP [Pseudomonadota bacterium]
MRRFFCLGVIAVLAAAMALPGSSEHAAAQQTKIIRLATLAPRSSPLVRGLKRIDQELRAATGNEVGIKIYPSGVAGDEKDVIRKMRVGQIDATVVTTTGLSQIVRETTVLNTPGVITNSKQAQAVLTELKPEWQQAFTKSGFQLLAWGELGQFRYFSKQPIAKPADIRRMRPWLWPESYTMKAMWQAIGATGVPLGVPEVYGALQTRMIDMVTSTAIAFTSLQWHTKLSHVTDDTFGVLMGALVVTKKKWDSLSDGAKAKLAALTAEDTEGNNRAARKADRKAYKRLLKRGYKASKFTPEGMAELKKIQNQVRQKLTGRVYPAELLKRVQAITAKTL